jgi:addiction module HigA family antidote
MPKITQSPGTALTMLLKKHKLNYNRLAKAIGLSSAMVRLIARDENPVSAPVAFRLSRFFKTSPEYWLSLQLNYEIAVAEQDKKLSKSLKEIPTVDKATFERKPKTAKAAKPVKRGKAAKGKKAAAPKKAASKKAVTKKPVAKKTAKTTAAKRGRPVKSAGVKKPAPVKQKPAANETRTPPPSADMTINEPNI